jgi:hypothetical protein
MLSTTCNCQTETWQNDGISRRDSIKKQEFETQEFEHRQKLVVEHAGNNSVLASEAAFAPDTIFYLAIP